MEIELLGPPRLRVGAEPVKVPGRQRALLAALALRARRPVSVSRLLDVVWGDEPLPEDPANALQQRISALRRLVDPQRRGDLLVGGEAGYTLHVDDDQVDVRRFEGHVAQGRRLLQAGDAAGAEAVLSTALALWRGPALDGCAEEPWAVAEVARLEELRASALEDRVDALLALGRHDELVADLHEQVADAPLRERTTAQLMTALYRAGRQADALSAYESLRERLVDDLGVDPGSEVQALHRRILQQDPALEVPPHAMAARASSGNIPAERSAVIGREAAVEQLAQLLDTARLVTLTGPGGAGKTTLALAAVRRRTPPHGVWLVELGALTDADALVAAVGRALGIGGGLTGALAPDTLAAAIAGRELLLVVDNCEHLLAAVADLLDRLLAAAPGLAVLATSRASLGLPGEVVWSVPPLVVPAMGADADRIRSSPAVRLLLERARGHAPELLADDEAAPLLAEVARRLDGIPLALELAAARLRVLSLEELRSGLDDRFRILAGGAARAPSRQRTLRGALDWSWELLDAHQQAALVALSVPVSAFTLADAASLLDAAGVRDDPLSVVADLVDRSLLMVQRRERGARYRMLESVRDYARQRLDDLGLSEVVRRAHATLVEADLDRCHADAGFPDLEGLDARLDDARAALRWLEDRGDRLAIQRVVGRLGWVWLLRGLGAEALGWLDRALGPATEVVPAASHPEAVLWASALRASAGSPRDAERWTAHATAATAPGSSLRLLADVFAAVHLANAQRLDEATAVLAEAAGAAEAAEAAEVPGWVSAFARLVDAQLARIFGRLDRAGARAERALTELDGPRLAWARMYVLAVLADVAYQSGAYPLAVERARAALALEPFPPVPEVEAGLHVQLALALAELGDLGAADRALSAGRAAVAALPPCSATGYVHLAEGVLAHQRSSADDAAAAFGAAIALHEEGVPVLGIARAHAELTRVRTGLGDLTGAAEVAGRGLALATAMGDPRSVPLLLEALASAAVGADRHAEALDLLATARALRAAAAAPAPPHEARHGETLLDHLRQVLGDHVVDARWEAAGHRAHRDPDELVSALHRALASGP
jgi:predicted ATPase/DNA-binding SARP family transcriptional activator